MSKLILCSTNFGGPHHVPVEPEAMKVLHSAPGLEDIWQLHFSQLSGQEYTVPGLFIANLIDTPPYHAYAVTCGITFTFGGIRINNDAAVQSVSGSSIPGLFAAGEIVGGLFYFNYPSGTGLVSGAVYGRIAGTSAAAHAKTAA